MTFRIALLLVLLSSQTLAAECQIENWRFQNMNTYILIEGTTTCPSGRILIRGYDKQAQAHIGPGEPGYLGNAIGYIKGFAFSAIITNAQTKELEIKYVVETD